MKPATLSEVNKHLKTNFTEGITEIEGGGKGYLGHYFASKFKASETSIQMILKTGFQKCKFEEVEDLLKPEELGLTEAKTIFKTGWTVNENLDFYKLEENQETKVLAVEGTTLYFACFSPK